MRNKAHNLFRLGLAVSILLLLQINANAQFDPSMEEDHTYKPLKIDLNEDGSKYLRFIMWHQLWVTTNDLDDKQKLQLTPSIRRSRFLAYAQVSSRFLILTHFGLNNLNPNNLTALGNDGNAPQFFLHDAWGELKVTDHLYLGAGLHYWKGLTRLSNASTLNFMTLDQPRPFIHWHSLGITDQFARHLGVYAKGQIGKFDYRIAMNAPGRNPLGGGIDLGLNDSGLGYTGATDPDLNGDPTGNMILEGYFRYNFWEKESTKLPYQVGSYLGKKKVLGIGTGFFLHPNGMFNSSTGSHGDVRHLAVDAFMEYPTGDGNMIHAYASLIDFDYGENYVSRWAGTGTNVYGQLGYFFGAAQLMPYVAYQRGAYEGLNEPIRALDVGLNYFINGHNCKITLEYHHIQGDMRESMIPTEKEGCHQLRLQLQVFL